MTKTLSEIKAEEGRDLDSSLAESTLIPGEGANFGAFSLSALWNWIKGKFTNVVEADNMNAVTSNAVNSKLGDYVKTADIADKVEKDNMNAVTSNAVNSKLIKKNIYEMFDTGWQVNFLKNIVIEKNEIVTLNVDIQRPNGDIPDNTYEFAGIPTEVRPKYTVIVGGILIKSDWSEKKPCSVIIGSDGTIKVGYAEATTGFNRIQFWGSYTLLD